MRRVGCCALVLAGQALLPVIGAPDSGESDGVSTSAYRLEAGGGIALTLQGVTAQDPPAEGRSAELRILLKLPTTESYPTNASPPGLPVTGLYYDHQGIRYTRTTCLTPVRGRDTSGEAEERHDLGASVLLIQLTGQNTASEYTDASAGLSLEMDNQPLDLELNAGLLRGRWKNTWVTLGAVQVPAEGVEASNDPQQLKFRGHMPPGTSGSMTIKIPTQYAHPPGNLDWLLDMDFTEELRRLARRADRE